MCVGKLERERERAGERERPGGILYIKGRILQYMLSAYDGRAWTEFIWLRIGTSGWLLWMW